VSLGIHLSRCHAVCAYAVLVSTAKVMRCIQCSLVLRQCQTAVVNNIENMKEYMRMNLFSHLLSKYDLAPPKRNEFAKMILCAFYAVFCIVLYCFYVLLLFCAASA